MEKHITVVGVLHVVYASLRMVLAAFLFAILVSLGPIFKFLFRIGAVDPGEIPVDLWNILPVILFIVIVVLFVVGLLGILGGLGVMKHREWARLLVIVLSFFYLVRIPLGTLLGIYSLWVLLNDETIRTFTQAPSAPVTNP